MSNGMHSYSHGIVAENLAVEDKGIIKVYPKDIIPEHDGELSDKGMMKASFQTANGDTKELEIEKTVVIFAHWLNTGGGDRHTPPLVTKGTTVQIHRAYNTDQFFWTILQNEPDLRRKDSILHMVGNTDEFAVILDETNTYFTLTDTINKKIRLKTNDNDGEAAWYDMLFDLKKGTFKLLDSNDNYIELDTVANKLTVDVDIMEFNASTSFTVNSPEVTINTEEYALNTTNSTTIAESTISKLCEIYELTTESMSTSFSTGESKGDTMDTTLKKSTMKSNEISETSKKKTVKTKTSKMETESHTMEADSIDTTTDSYDITTNTFDIQSDAFDITTTSYDIDSTSFELSSGSVDLTVGNYSMIATSISTSAGSHSLTAPIYNVNAGVTMHTGIVTHLGLVTFSTGKVY